MYILALSNNILYIQDTTGLAPQSYDLSLFIATVLGNDLQVVEIATDVPAAYVTFDQIQPIEGIDNMLELAYSIGLATPPAPDPQQVEVTNPQETVEVTNTVEVQNSTDVEAFSRVPFAVDFGTKTFDLPAINKYYALFIFRPKIAEPTTLRTILEAFISVMGQTNDDFLVNVVINPTFVEGVMLDEAWWEDLGYNSQMEYIRPKITGLSGFAAVPTSLEVSSLGWNTFSKYGRQQTEVSERMKQEIHLPSNGSIKYAIIVSSDTTGCKIKAGVSLLEKIG